MSVGNLVHVLLTVYNATVHVTQRSPGPMSGCVGMILRPDSCISGSLGHMHRDVQSTRREKVDRNVVIR